MTRIYPEGEPISVKLNSDGYPQQFIWNGRAHNIQSIRQQWQVDTDWWSEEEDSVGEIRQWMGRERQMTKCVYEPDADQTSSPKSGVG